MRIKNLIRRWFGRSVIVIESNPEIYVADMTNRSKNVRGIEITDHQQPSPDGKGMMDSLVFHNPNILSVDCCIFNDHDFKNPRTGKDDKHCEGCYHRGIILNERIYGIISFPRRHVSFNDTIFTDVYETTRLKRFTGIRYYATNEAIVIDDLRVRPII